MTRKLRESSFANEIAIVLRDEGALSSLNLSILNNEQKRGIIGGLLQNFGDLELSPKFESFFSAFPLHEKIFIFAYLSKCVRISRVMITASLAQEDEFSFAIWKSFVEEALTETQQTFGAGITEERIVFVQEMKF